MKQEEKSLLLKDLCARLPYGVKIRLDDELIGTLDAVYPTDDRVIVDGLSKAIAYYNVRCGGFNLEENNVKPYLRSLSSMTEEEKELCRSFKRDIMYQGFGDIELYMNRYVKWLDSEHFDWRTNDNGKTLIELGLALEAPEGMYNLNGK